MKIAYIHTSIIPSNRANSVQVMKMCDAMTELGYDLTLISPDVRGVEINEQQVDQYGTRNNFNILRISRLRSRLGFITYGIQSVLTALKMNPDLIYTRCLSSALFLTFLNQPYIYEVHQKPATVIERGATRRIVIANKCVRLVTISHELKDLLGQLFPKVKSKIMVAHNAVNLKDFDGADPTCPQNLTEKCKKNVVCLYVGTITAGRGIEQMIKSAEDHQEALFVFVGETDPNFELPKESVPNNVFFIGRIPHSAIPGIMKCADILLLPYQPEARIMNRRNSSTGEYCSPMKAFEYMAAKGAIVCSDIPNLREIYVNNNNAIFVSPPHSAHAWSETLDKIISSPVLRQKLARNAYALAQKHTWLYRAEKVLSDIL